MQIHQAQRDVRLVYVGGSFGQLVSGILWLGAPAAEAFSSATVAIAILLRAAVRAELATREPGTIDPGPRSTTTDPRTC